MADDGFRFGQVVRNRLVRDFTVMILAELPPWQYRPGHRFVPQALGIVLTESSSRHIGSVTTISGDYADWVAA